MAQPSPYFGHILREVTENLKAYSSVLDLGCGIEMRDLRLLGQLRIPLAIGIDVQKKPSIDRGEIEYISSDFDDVDLPMINECLDLIILNNVIEHLYHPKRVLEECRRCLRVGGRIAILTPNQARLINRARFILGRSIYFPLEYWLGSGEEKIVKRGQTYFAGHIREYTPDEIRRMLEVVGFKVSSIALYPAAQASPREQLSQSKLLRSVYNVAERMIPGSKYEISAIAVKR